MGYYGYGEDCSAAHSAQQAADEARREVDYLRSDVEDRIRSVRHEAESEAAGLRGRIADLEDRPDLTPTRGAARSVRTEAAPRSPQGL